jgi:hypothetical protein
VITKENDRRGSCRFDDHPATDEKTSADDTAESNHHHVAAASSYGVAHLKAEECFSL